MLPRSCDVFSVAPPKESKLLSEATNDQALPRKNACSFCAHQVPGIKDWSKLAQHMFWTHAPRAPVRSCPFFCIPDGKQFHSHLLEVHSDLLFGSHREENSLKDLLTSLNKRREAVEFLDSLPPDILSSVYKNITKESAPTASTAAMLDAMDLRYYEALVRSSLG